MNRSHLYDVATNSPLTLVEIHVPHRTDHREDNSLTDQFVYLNSLLKSKYKTQIVPIARNVYAWGYSYKTLGLEDTSHKKIPTLIPSFSDKKIISMQGGHEHTIFLTHDGQVWACGINSSGNCGLGHIHSPIIQPVRINSLERIKKIELHHGKTSFALSGELYTWGANTYGQIGNGETKNQDSPFLHTFARIRNVYSGGYGDGNFCFVETVTGQYFAWGRNNEGMLGLGHINTVYQPEEFTALQNVKQFALGNYHTLALTEDGKVWSWGRNASHCLGRGVALSGENTPGEVTTLQNCKIVALDAGSDLSVALSATGNVYSWGHNANGQCGQSICNTVPTEIAKLIDVKIVQIACSDWSTHFLDNTGRIWACGYNGEGRLGTGDEADRKVPEQVNTKCILDAGDKIFKIGCGAYHTFALTN